MGSLDPQTFLQGDCAVVTKQSLLRIQRENEKSYSLRFFFVWLPRERERETLRKEVEERKDK